MLSVQKLAYGTRQYSSSCICNKTFLRYTVNSRIQTTDRRYGQWVPDKYLVTEKDLEKYKIDPEVKKLGRVLVHSDYVEKKSLRLEYKVNRREFARLRRNAEAQRLRDLIEKPVMSVALKYMTDAKNLPKESNEDNKSTVEAKTTNPKESETTNNNDSLIFKRNGKPIHMPYAATDTYETIEEKIDEVEANIQLPELNEKYKALYEKYLASKETELDDETLSKLMASEENEQQLPLYKEEANRPAESLTKVPPNWMTDYHQYDDNLSNNESWKANYGTPNPEIPVSSIPCGGCGALLHCKDPAIPGYLPSELFVNQPNKILRSSICQRCHFMKHYNTTLEVKVAAEEYPVLLSHLKKKKVAVVMMVDLTDFPCSIWPGIMDVLGKTTQVYVVGNKVDLLPNDGPNFLKRVRNSLIQSVHEMGIGKANIKGVNLISAKTGYGIEELINRLHKVWEYKGDVYMLGCTNVGKSSLFNALLQSDYCKVQAVDLVQRATISPWPGTTLNLLKFPILNPVRWRLIQRSQRLSDQQEALVEEEEFKKQLYWDTKNLNHLTLEGHIGKTFQKKREEGPGYIGRYEKVDTTGYFGVNENSDDYKNSRWFYDTPGTMHPDQILNFLTTEELMMALPQRIISPRTFRIYKNYTLFVAGLGRLDHVGGSRKIRFTVFASEHLPVTICKTSRADEIYERLIQTEAFAVPVNDPERLKVFPALKSKDLTVTGIGTNESAADVVLSSIGWVAVTAKEGEEVVLKAWTPEARGIYLRTPALLSRSVALRGTQFVNSVAYKRGRQAYSKR